ncbi:MAG: hypothetical protein ACD_28C00077G0010 [uncultured bacterium]|nr:MAG: hypothetical protein ACD_28C00077G0010 [uncultured bacterium]
MRSVNKVILMGNLAADPELRSTKTGRSITTFPLATHSEWRDNEGEMRKSTDFHRIITWQGLADHCNKHLKKGSAIYIEGKLQNRTYEDKNKAKHYITEVTAESVNFIRTHKGKEGENVVIAEEEVPQ